MQLSGMDTLLHFEHNASEKFTHLCAQNQYHEFKEQIAFIDLRSSALNRSHDVSYAMTPELEQIFQIPWQQK